MRVSETFEIFDHYIKAVKLMRKFKDRNQLEKWQQDRLKEFFEKTLALSPFYKDYSYADFRNIPIISKKEMLESFDRINTVGLNKSEAFEIALKAEQTRNFLPEIKDYTVGLSSGTSGQRGLFVASAEERRKWAGIMLAKTLGDKIWQSQKVALFLRANSNLYESLETGKHIAFKYFDITYGVDTHIDSLNYLQPDILTGPASILRHLALLQASGVLQIKPRQILSGAEVLDPMDQAFIEDVFKLPVRQIYQCTEGFLGMTNHNGQFLLNEEYVLIEKEYIDGSPSRFTPIITDFTRTTQPIVRYRLDDVLIEDKYCSSPFTTLKTIEGRCDDIFYFLTRAGKPIPVYADILRQTLISSGVDYSEYQLIQKSEHAIDLKIAPSLSESETIKIKQVFENLCQRLKSQSVLINILPYNLSANAVKLRRIYRDNGIKAAVAA
ncbi:MAG: adenylate cyclase [Alphaproteobacteria bacterium]|nr:adenylate cyclase [Alphaproteobacteria bacterium]